MGSLLKRLAGLSRSDVLRQALLGLGLQAFGKVLAFGLTLLLARLLQASEFGSFAYARNWVFLLGPLATLGYVGAAQRFIPGYLYDEAYGSAAGFTWHCFRVVTTVGVAVAVAFAAAAVTFPDLIDGSYWWAALCILPSIPAYAVLFALLAVGRSFNLTVVAYAPLLIAQPLLHLLLFYLAVAGGLPADGVTASASFAAATVLVCAASLPILWAHVPRAVREARRVTLRRPWLEFALPTSVTVGASTVMARFPTVAVGLFSAATGVGQFAVALAVAQTLAMARDAASGAVLPELSRRVAANDVAGARRVLALGLAISLVPTLLGASIFWIAGDRILGVFGQSFIGAGPLLDVLVLDQLIQTAALLPSAFLTVVARPLLNIRILSASAFVGSAMSLVLASQWGPAGAAFGSLTASLVLLVLTSLACRKELSRLGRVKASSGPA
ncbi:lipopolysaccharide biosynthesis protein [Salinarimonas soli]|uniref:Oligosaccharide flippase family protein n=1 Tax=Salinarimonas soli TaxID=1638099 RepID=A0A5B2V885_9HYPH|nr:oligosaccharide flippase family protein [Salinarimonas soli]KAA2234785.1 oligosaccharide flippase family protein [Salinarimonas soli]